MLGLLKDTRQFDGYFVDRKGQAFPPSTAMEEIEPLGESGNPDVVYINGILTDTQRQLEDMTRLAKTGKRVVGVHNATAGVVRDLGQSIMDKVNRGPNSAVDTVKKLVRTATEVGNQLKLVAHSQGALVVSRAIDELLEEEQVTREGLDSISVDTYGGASYTYPNGPRYFHHMNLLDPVPMLMGAGYLGALKHSPGVKLEMFARAQAPFRVPGEPWTKTVGRAFDRSLHGTSVYFDPDSHEGLVWTA
jgi:hypothetical protein